MDEDSVSEDHIGEEYTAEESVLGEQHCPLAQASASHPSTSQPDLSDPHRLLVPTQSSASYPNSSNFGLPSHSPDFPSAASSPYSPSTDLMEPTTESAAHTILRPSATVTNTRSKFSEPLS
jgi:hypothetical protein